MPAIIRDAALEDAGSSLAIYAYSVTHTAVTFEYDPPTLPEFRARMAGLLQKYPCLVIEEGGAVQGFAYAHAFYGRAAYDW